MRLRKLGRPPRLVVAIFIAGLALIAIGLLVIHGTPTTYAHIPGQRGRAPVTETGPRDVIRFAFAIAGLIVIGFGFVRWNDARERADQRRGGEARLRRLDRRRAHEHRSGDRDAPGRLRASSALDDRSITPARLDARTRWSGESWWRCGCEPSHRGVLGRANMTRYWPSLRPCAARFSPPRPSRELSINHLGLGLLLRGHDTRRSGSLRPHDARDHRQRDQDGRRGHLLSEEQGRPHQRQERLELLHLPAAGDSRQ